jgi:dolichol-phosphate mannosyltransferase
LLQALSDIALPENTPPVLVIVPTYNEAENIDQLLEMVLALPPAISVLVIDDGSPDGTADIVKLWMKRQPERLRLLERPVKSGLGRAYITGFDYALSNGFEIICEMDADLSHNPADLPRLIQPIVDGEADLTIGSRYVGGVRVMNWPIRRVLLSYGASFYTRLITRLPVYDVTAGFKAYHRRVLESLDFRRVKSEGYSFQIELKYRAWRRGFRLKEIPIVFTERTEGQSKMSKAIVREAALKVWEIRLRDLLRRL